MQNQTPQKSTEQQKIETKSDGIEDDQNLETWDELGFLSGFLSIFSCGLNNEIKSNSSQEDLDMDFSDFDSSSPPSPNLISTSSRNSSPLPSPRSKKQPKIDQSYSQVDGWKSFFQFFGFLEPSSSPNPPPSPKSNSPTPQNPEFPSSEVSPPSSPFNPLHQHVEKVEVDSHPTSFHNNSHSMSPSPSPVSSSDSVSSALHRLEKLRARPSTSALLAQRASSSISQLPPSPPTSNSVPTSSSSSLDSHPVSLPVLSSPEQSSPPLDIGGAGRERKFRTVPRRHQTPPSSPPLSLSPSGPLENQRLEELLIDGREVGDEEEEADTIIRKASLGTHSTSHSIPNPFIFEKVPSDPIISTINLPKSSVNHQSHSLEKIIEDPEEETDEIQ